MRRIISKPLENKRITVMNMYGLNPGLNKTVQGKQHANYMNYVYDSDLPAKADTKKKSK